LRHEVAAKKQKLLSGGLDKLFFCDPAVTANFPFRLKAGRALRLKCDFLTTDSILSLHCGGRLYDALLS
jgi:hypothetical protein